MAEQRTSYVRRFVRTGMILLIVQLFAAIATVALTAWATFYVVDLREERDQLRTELEQLRAADDFPDQVYVEQPVEQAQPDEGAIEEDGAQDVTDTSPVPTPPNSTAMRPTVVTSRPAPSQPAQTRPTPSRPVGTATPRPSRPTPAERPPRTRPPASTTPTPARPTPNEPEPTPPPRRNTVYPGGLPGQGSNTEPPFIPDRPRGRTPVNPDPGNPGIDLPGLVGQGSQLETDPPRTPDRPQIDRNQQRTDTLNPNRLL